MKKRWFVVVLTIGLLLSVLPLSALALSPDPTITDADGNILGWSDLSTVPYSLDDLQEQRLAVVDEKPDTAAAPGLWETGSEKSLADADSKRLAVVDAKSGTVAAPGLSETGLENSLADEGSDETTDGLSDEESEDDDPADNPDSTTTSVCKIGEETYSTLDEAISKAKVGDQIDLLRDIEQDTGLEFREKTLTISGGGSYELTLNEKGIYAYKSKLTFQDLTLDIHAATHSYEGGSGCTANLITDSDLIMNNVIFTLTPGDPSVSGIGSGIYLHRYSNLYLNGTTAEIHGFKGIECSGIYADESNINYAVDPVENREIKLVSSTLTVTDCGWNGMTINPVDLYLTGSNVYLNHNGKGGLGTYWGKLKMEASTLTADDNGTGSDDFSKTWGLFVDQLDMDERSTLNACNNHGVAGILIGDGGVIQSGAELNCNDNDYIGLYVFLDRNNEWYGDVVIEPGATVTACNNAYSGVHNANKLKIEGTVIADSNKLFGITNDAGDELIITNTAEVSARQNLVFGIFNYDNAKLTVKSDASLKVEENTGSGILNGRNATLNLNAGSIQRNNARYGINDGYVAQGGGIQNWGTAILSDDVELYNNHATSAGDDIYNADVATITFGDTGRGWELDGAPDCYDFITGWYDDSHDARWNAHGDDESTRHTDLVQPGELTGARSLKAAHGVLSTGSLTVRKELIGDLLSSDYDTEFTFELTLDDNTITTMNDKWCGVPFQNGKASFTLKGGESITISNLPAGVGYTVTEAAQSNWIQLNVSGGADIGVVPRNDIAEIVFTNQKIGVDFPDVPIIPIEPEEPEIPEEPEKPQTPEVPEEPKGPETPKETETLQETEAPAQDQTPGELPAEEPAQADTAVPTQPVETPTQNTTAETLIQTGTTDWLAAVLMFSGFGLLVCGWVFNRKQRAKKH